MHVTNIWMHLYYSYPFLLGCWTRDGGISNALRCSSEIASKHPIWIFGILERFEFRLSLQITKVDFPKHGWWHRHVRGQTDTSLKCFNDGVSQVLVVNLNQLNLLFLVLPSFFLIRGGGQGGTTNAKSEDPDPKHLSVQTASLKPTFWFQNSKRTPFFGGLQIPFPSIRLMCFFFDGNI